MLKHAQQANINDLFVINKGIFYCLKQISEIENRNTDK